MSHKNEDKSFRQHVQDVLQRNYDSYKSGCGCWELCDCNYYRRKQDVLDYAAELGITLKT